MPTFEGKLTGTLTKEGEEFVTSVLTPPRKIVMTLSELGMQNLRELKPGAVIDFTMGSETEQTTTKCKVVRRDWKRCKVHLLELK